MFLLSKFMPILSMSVAGTCMCVIWLGGFGSEWVYALKNLNDNTLHSTAGNSQQAHCAGGEVHVCNVSVYVDVHVCVCVSAL